MRCRGGQPISNETALDNPNQERMATETHGFKTHSIPVDPARAKPPADYVGVAHFSVFYLFENRRRRLKIFGILNSELGALSALNFGFIAPDLRFQFRILL